MNAYKVVKVLANGELVSFIAEGKALVKYRINKWVSAPKWLSKKGYYLCVFKDLERAKIFIENDNPLLYEIYECEVDELIDKLPPALNPFAIGLGEIEFAPRPDFPEGTYMARKVKLLRRVWA